MACMEVSWLQVLDEVIVLTCDRYWTQGHSECYHRGVLVCVQGCAVRLHCSGAQEARPQVSR